MLKPYAALIMLLLAGCDHSGNDRMMKNIFNEGIVAGNDYIIIWKYHPGPAPTICWMGDSRIELFQNEWYFANNQFNIGKVGATTMGLLVRVPYVINWRPDIVIISCGMNDKTENYAGTAERIRQAIVQMQPYVKRIIVTNIVPLTTYNPYLQDANVEIRQVCLDEGVEFLDLADMEISDGILNPAYTTDGVVHYNAAGYTVFSEAVRSML